MNNNNETTSEREINLYESIGRNREEASILEDLTAVKKAMYELNVQKYEAKRVLADVELLYDEEMVGVLESLLKSIADITARLHELHLEKVKYNEELRNCKRLTREKKKKIAMDNLFVTRVEHAFINKIEYLIRGFNSARQIENMSIITHYVNQISEDDAKLALEFKTEVFNRLHSDVQDILSMPYWSERFLKDALAMSTKSPVYELVRELVVIGNV